MVEVGRTLMRKRVFSQEDFNRFAVLSGDDNPIHTDPAFAARTRFGRTVSHGMLLYAAVDGLLRTGFPAAARIEQELMFPHPTYAGEDVTVKLTITEVNPAERLVWLDALITKPDETIACQGRTLLRLPEGG